MKKVNNYVLKYLLFSFPLVLVVVFVSQTGIDGIVWEILAWHMIFWFAMLSYALFALLFSPSLRDRLLSKLARIKERDERESHIIGKSSRFTFFQPLRCLCFFVFCIGQHYREQITSRT